MASSDRIQFEQSRKMRSEAIMNVLTLPEAAQLMRCSKAHLLNVIHGRVANVPPLPCVRIGRRILIRREALERWLAAVEGNAVVSA
jgi:excisionase family DNA binding protein